MLRFRIISANDNDTGSSYKTADEAVKNCPPGRGIRDAETGKKIDPDSVGAKRDQSPRWF
jgi:hypothetical protein